VRIEVAAQMVSVAGISLDGRGGVVRLVVESEVVFHWSRVLVGGGVVG